MNTHYKKVVNIRQFEFGLVYENGRIETIIIDLLTLRVASLAFSEDEKDAELVIETCIQYGYKGKGVEFKPVPGYRLQVAEVI